MWHSRVRRAALAATAILGLVAVLAAAAPAQAAPSEAQGGAQVGAQTAGAQAGLQDKRQNTPGEFDFYVLALSWAPSYCAERSERATSRRPDPECNRPLAFVVHGLWPQYEQGFPAYCQVPAPRLDRAQVSRALDVMPSPSLIFREWQRHGTCSGLAAGAYFETVREARAVVKIPQAYLDLATPVSVTPADVADAFVKANAGLAREDMAVACDKTRLTEVRLCLGKDFSFRACPEVVRRSCARDKIEVPAMHSEHAAAMP